MRLGFGHHPNSGVNIAGANARQRWFTLLRQLHVSTRPVGFSHRIASTSTVSSKSIGSGRGAPVDHY